MLSRNGLGVLPFAFPVVLGGSQILGMLPGAYLGPLTAAFTVTAIADGRPGLRHWGARLVRWRVGWRWYVAVLVGVPASILVTTALLPTSWGHLAAPGAAVLAAYLPVLLLQARHHRDRRGAGLARLRAAAAAGPLRRRARHRRARPAVGRLAPAALPHRVGRLAARHLGVAGRVRGEPACRSAW
ncbi:hypothetical protein GCM10025868_21680 [Angustibacter aerolatus]|uniref:Membrane transporter protein n=1 Tax=Angustibacter aerolatus TaxID=1162965 RepID=A0ABQ6JFE9_9ACTN|nr:hypothetical protein [Angustibacter aerolatus]GMA86918.1 hypothetical protein GCM10025868_21680 [Angustibacter aerolatus]